jgi:hypothetical protein
MEEINQKLREAIALINDERFDEALPLLEDVLREDSNNVQALWLVANAVDTPDDARGALERIVALDPGHEQAQGMLDQLNQMYPPEAAEVVAEAADDMFAFSLDDEAEPAAADDDPFAFGFDDEDEVAVEAEPAAAGDDPFAFSFDDDDDDAVAAEAEPAAAGDDPFAFSFDDEDAVAAEAEPAAASDDPFAFSFDDEDEVEAEAEPAAGDDPFAFSFDDEDAAAPAEEEAEDEGGWLAFDDESPREALADDTQVDSVFDRDEEEIDFDEGEFDFEEEDDWFDADEAAALDDIDGFDEEDDSFDFDALGEDEVMEEKSGGRLRRLLLPVLGLLVVILVAVVISSMVLGGGGDDDQDQPTLLAGATTEPTDAAISAAEVATATPDQPPTATPDAALAALETDYADALLALDEAMADVGLQDASAGFRTTSEGPALVTDLCWAQPGGGWFDDVLKAMQLATEPAESMEADGVSAVGVELKRCGSDDVLFSAVAGLNQAVDHFVNADSTLKDFQATWQTP